LYHVPMGLDTLGGYPSPPSLSREPRNCFPAAHRILPNQSRIASALTIFFASATQGLGFSIVANDPSSSVSERPQRENALLRLLAGPVAASRQVTQLPRRKEFGCRAPKPHGKSQALEYILPQTRQALLEDDPTPFRTTGPSMVLVRQGSPFEPERPSRYNYPVQ